MKFLKILKCDLNHTFPPEILVLPPYKGGDGIWDILGYYDPYTRTVNLCDSKIKEESLNIKGIVGYNAEIVYGVLRELVRLHEHIHALIHTSSLSPNMTLLFHYKTNTQDWYSRLPSEINEPLTEFLSYILVKRSESSLFLKIF